MEIQARSRRFSPEESLGKVETKPELNGIICDVLREAEAFGVDFESEAT